MSRLDDLFDPLPTHLSVDQLAKVLGVNRGTAYNWLKAGHIPAYRVGQSWVIVRDEVKDHLAAHRNQPLKPEEPRQDT
ncbi:excisionase family DNA binding protein [Georgenia soli]|uniref:Excisionase family DNA binding protein n=1 Tax=Georgenia soli TaxID=638953 RepID=A0A2A9F0M1_9MICO|nr:helix-turn-helix domain-containing protein [Georgenia soli]PFG44947.1 excisionase family DNA binding protein [Georgenia soli]